MIFRKFSADKIFDGYNFLESDRVLIMDEKGTVEAIVPLTEAGDDVQRFDGILSPGFINCHCHLELSHLKNVIPPHTGLIDFLCSVVTKRGFDPAIIQQEITAAEKEMFDNGTVAVGDIGNTADTAAVKSKSSIRWQNFVEVLGFTDEKADENMTHFREVANQLKSATKDNPVPHRTTVVPHAPYTISVKTFEMINAATANQVISIHNQEHPAEDELYKTGGGDYLKLFKVFGVLRSPFPVTGKSSIRNYLPHFNNGQTILLIHNTYMPEEDVEFANDYAAKNGLKLIWCLCVNANLYIENKTPPIDLFIKHGCPLVLGTDSYSSNWQLSIGSEIKSIHQRFPHIPLEQILHWATMGGAKALKWDDALGSFEKGKRPGIVLSDPGFEKSKSLTTEKR